MGIIDNESKQIRLEASLNRDSNTIKKFINKFIGYGNIIVSDGWSAYSWIDDNNSGYSHITHIHSGGDFGLGLSSHHILNLYGMFIKLKLKLHIIQYILKIL